MHLCALNFVEADLRTHLSHVFLVRREHNSVYRDLRHLHADLGREVLTLHRCHLVRVWVWLRFVLANLLGILLKRRWCCNLRECFCSRLQLVITSKSLCNDPSHPYLHSNAFLLLFFFAEMVRHHRPALIVGGLELTGRYK